MLIGTSYTTILPDTPVECVAGLTPAIDVVVSSAAALIDRGFDEVIAVKSK